MAANGKKKILVLSDHALSTSGVGTQSRFLINGLVDTGKYTIRQFGAAMKHENYNVVKVNDDFIIKPTDGFGTPEMIRLALATEKPDMILLFTDPRFFHWLFKMEDEIHQVCPIAYWHVWDNKPYPEFNDMYYEGTDLIACHSHHTYEQISPKYPDKTYFVPHTLPNEVYFRMTPEKIQECKDKWLPNKKDWFVGFWSNRNARRKRPNDLLWSWSMFLEKLEKQEGHRKAVLLMHTDPFDSEGPNLLALREKYGMEENVIFSTERVGFEQLNEYYNAADFTINISHSEGFGLSTLESMMTGTPIIAPMTGGQTRQVQDHRDNTQNGIALPIEFQTMVGNQQIPYILEDYTSVETISEAMLEMYQIKKLPIGYSKLCDKVKAYVDYEFNYQNRVNQWDNLIGHTIQSWKTRYNRYKMEAM
jgi:glycosyltransferase involved in cell wall biosynthesis